MSANEMKKVLILGGTGMLGSMVVDVLGRDPAMSVVATKRLESQTVPSGSGVPFVAYDAEADANRIDEIASGFDWIVNCIGVIKPFIKEDDPVKTERAIVVNALFPHRLAAAAEKAGAKVLQIATDCVYSGTRGGYLENAPHDALDVYGKTKSLGEVPHPTVTHLRCSIIGPEPVHHVSLLDWFRGQPEGAKLTGFSNHKWNGITTLQFAKIAAGVIRATPTLPGSLHVVPGDVVTKADMLERFADAFGRRDLAITHAMAAIEIDRTLGSNHPEANAELWRCAGYAAAPKFDEMIAELAAWSQAG